MSNRKFSSPKDISSRIIFSFLALLLSGLLLLKFSGQQSIFSYQGIRNNTAGFSSYKSGIQAINNYLNTALGTQSLQLDEGINNLEQALGETTDKNLLALLSDQLKSAQDIKIIWEISHCIDIITSGYNTIGSIKSEYNNILIGYDESKRKFKERIDILPEGETKICLSSYLKGLENSMEALIFTHNNIQNIEDQYGTLLTDYKDTAHTCWSIESVSNQLTQMHSTMNKVKTIIDGVNTKLEEQEEEKLEELCAYGQIQGLTGLQSSSRKITQDLKTTQSTLGEVKNIKEYINSLMRKSVVSSGENKQTRYQNLVNKILK
jgi:hypothetical protein